MKKIILYGLIAVIVISMLGGCSNKKSASSAEKDIEAQIESMLGATEQPEGDGLFGMIANNNKLFSDDKYGRKISEKVSCEIENIEIGDESGTVTLSIESPDVYQLLKESASEFDSENDVDELLVLVSQKLDGAYPEINKTVSCDMKFENEKWNLVMNADLLDALSGNLYSGYFAIADSVIESVEEE